MRPRYWRPFATTKRFSVTLMAERPRSASVRELSGRTSRTRDGSTESRTTIQRAPAGIAPTPKPRAGARVKSAAPPLPPGAPPPAPPVATSLMNSSPLSGPPSDAYAAPLDSPMRSSGSALGGGGPDGAGRLPQLAPTSSAMLATARGRQRRIELGDREFDVCHRVRGGNEAGFERRGREKDSACEGRGVPAREQRGVGRFGIGVVAHWAVRQIHTPHGAGVSGRDWNAAAARGGFDPGHEPRRLGFQILIEAGPVRLSERRPGGGAS